MVEETLILNIEIDQGEALKSLQESESALIDLKNQQKELNDSLKAGTVTQQEYAASKVQLDQKIQSETANRKTLTQAINTESNSLNAQKARLKELIQERNNIDRSTVEGRAKFDQMNGSILNLNKSIKAAEEQGGSFQRNVGNYKGTIDQFTGGAYSAAEGLGKMTVQAVKFIATPIGAVIAAIALAIGSLIAYFKGSEEGQNKLNKIMMVGKAIFESVMDVVEELGGVIFTVIEKSAGAIGKFFSWLGLIPPQLEANLKIAAEAGARLADMQAKLDKQERESLVNNSKKRLEVSKLRREADESEGQNKLDFLNAALALEKEIIDQEVADAELRLEIAQQEFRNGEQNKDQLKKIAEAEAAVFQAKANQFEETRKMNKERLATEKEIGDTILKRIDNDVKLQQQESERVFKANQKADEELAKAVERVDKKSQVLEESLMVNLDAVDAEAEAEKKAADDAYNWYVDTQDRKKAKAKKTEEEIVAMIMATGDVTADIFAKVTAIKNMEADLQIDAVKLQQQEELRLLQEKLDKGEISEEEFKEAKSALEKSAAKEIDDIKRKAFDANKVNLIAQSIIDAIQSGIAAFRALAGIPVVGPALGAVAAAAALAFGYKQVDLIRSQQYVPAGGFAEGGYTGPGGKHDVAGVVHRDEYVVPSWQVHNPAYSPHLSALEAGRMRGYMDGGLVKNSAVLQTDQAAAIANALKNLPPIYASWTEAMRLDASIKSKMSVVEA